MKRDISMIDDLKLPALNVLHIDIDRLEETLRIYESDRDETLERVPRLR